MNPLALPELFFLSGNKWAKKQDLFSAQSFTCGLLSTLCDWVVLLGLKEAKADFSSAVPFEHDV